MMIVEMACVQSIAALRIRIEHIWAEMLEITASKDVELNILYVIRLLVERENANIAVLKTDITVSEINISRFDALLASKRNDIDVIRGEIDVQTRSLQGDSPALSTAGNMILISIRDFSPGRDILMKIDNASTQVLNAIRNSRTPDLSSFTVDMGIVEILEASRDALGELVSTEAYDGIKGNKPFEMAGTALDSLFLWFIIQVFSDPAAAVNVFNTDKNIKASFQESAIRLFQLPYVLSVLLAG